MNLSASKIKKIGSGIPNNFKKLKFKIRFFEIYNYITTLKLLSDTFKIKLFLVFVKVHKSSLYFYELFFQGI